MGHPKNIAIVGGGFAGMAAALDLARAGYKVSIFEQDLELGGLGGAFEVLPGVMLEKFYHHWFTSDRAILGLIEELGLGSSIRALSSRTGLFYANSQFRLSTPLDLLKFSAIPLLDRIRMGLMVLRARQISNWKPLEDISAASWIRKYGGKKAYEVVWEPLLKGKFGPEAEEISAVWFWNKLKLRGGSRSKKGSEELLYFNGGFWALISALRDSLNKLGVEVHLGQKVEEIVSQGSGLDACVDGIKISGQLLPFSKVLATVPLPVFLGITPGLPDEYKARCARIRFLGNVCLVLRLNKSLSDTYWLNVADPSFPFVGIIEHTNFDDPKNFAGQRIAYISKYLPTSDNLYQISDQQFFEFCLPYIKRIFPDFSEDWVIGYNSWRAEFSQPVITKHYSQLIPEFRTPIKNLWLCTMAQVYPEDRGTNYAVQYGREIAARIVADYKPKA